MVFIQFLLLLVLEHLTDVKVQVADACRTELARVLEDIQSGRFTRDWMLENRVHQTSFKATRRRNAEHPIETVGEQLRGMMPWIGANRLVDKAKNQSGFQLPKNEPSDKFPIRVCFIHT